MKWGKLKALIYKVTNLINNKIYIGQTKNSLNRRRTAHLSSARHEKEHPGRYLYFHKALNKYGKENFKWEILESFENITKDELNEKEKYYISLYNSNNLSIGYNLTSGGDAQSEQSINFWNSSEGQVRKELLKENMKSLWSIQELHDTKVQQMYDFYKSDTGVAQAKRHKDFMIDYYNGVSGRFNKAKTSKWFVKATSPDKDELIFISSKEPNNYFNKDVHLRTELKNVGDVWQPTFRCKDLYGWTFEAIEKDLSLII